MPFAHPLSVYPVFKAPRKVPTFKERKEVTSRACPAWVCTQPTGALLVANAVLADPGPKRGGRSLGPHATAAGRSHFSSPAHWIWESSGVPNPAGSQAGAVVAACASGNQLWDLDPHTNSRQGPEQQQEPLSPVLPWGSQCVSRRYAQSMGHQVSTTVNFAEAARSALQSSTEKEMLPLKDT